MGKRVRAKRTAIVRIRSERARVLVTVKATPQPSERYGDTVCVAGVRLDGAQPKWIRLYPIAFRWLGDGAQFAKYDVIEIDVRRRDADTRSESYSPEQESWKKIDHLEPWKPRHEIIRQLEPTTTCRLTREAAADHRAPSLGLVYPTDVDDLVFSPHEPWTPEQLGKMKARIEKETEALIPSGVIPDVLKAPRLKVQYRYRCAEPSCTWHVGRILDWELTALQNRHRGSDEDLKGWIRTKYLDQKFNPKRVTGLFMGNFEHAPRRSRFSVLGVYSPAASDVVEPPPTLF